MIRRDQRRARYARKHTGMTAIGSREQGPMRLLRVLTLLSLAGLFPFPALALASADGTLSEGTLSEASPTAAQGSPQIILLPDPDTSKDMYRRLVELGTPEAQCTNGTSYVRNSFVTCIRQTTGDSDGTTPSASFQCTINFNLQTGTASSTDPCPSPSIIGVSN